MFGTLCRFCAKRVSRFYLKLENTLLKALRQEKKKKKEDKNKIQIILIRTCLYDKRLSSSKSFTQRVGYGMILHVSLVWRQKYKKSDFAFYARAQLMQHCNLVQAMFYLYF